MYILREHTITEYEIDALTREEAEKKFERGEYEQTAEWLDSYQIVRFRRKKEISEEKKTYITKRILELANKIDEEI